MSPVATSSFSVEMTGSPAPTVASFKNRAPLALLALKILSYRDRSPEYAFLLGVITLIPFSRKEGYSAATSSDEVLSTNATFWFRETRLASFSVRALRSGFWDDAASRDFHESPAAIGLAASKIVLVEEVKEISWNGETCGGIDRIWLIRSLPTRPTPTTATYTFEVGGDVDMIE